MTLYGIGSSAAAVTRLDLLATPIPWPKAEAPDYAVYVNNGQGQAIGQGWTRCYWRFTALTVAQWTVLRSYVGTCYIRTLEENGTYGRYQAVMVTPPRKPPKANELLYDVVVEFRKMVAA